MTIADVSDRCNDHPNNRGRKPQSEMTGCTGCTDLCRYYTYEKGVLSLSSPLSQRGDEVHCPQTKDDFEKLLEDGACTKPLDRFLDSNNTVGENMVVVGDLPEDFQKFKQAGLFLNFS